MALSENAPQLARLHKSVKKVFIFGDHQSGKSSIAQKLTGKKIAITQSKSEESLWKIYQMGQQPHIINVIDTGSFCSPLAVQRLGSASDCIFVLVYAHDNERSFKTVERIQARIKSMRCMQNVPPIIFACNKIETISHNKPQLPRLVFTQKLAAKMEWGVDFVPLSAKTGFGICKLSWVLLQCFFNMQLDFDEVYADYSQNASTWRRILKLLRGQRSAHAPHPLTGSE